MYPAGSIVHVGVSGTREGFNADQKQDFIDALYEIIDESPGCERFFHHGDCIGVDVQAAAIAHKLGYLVIAHPPEVDTYRGFYDSDVICAVKPFHDRNRDIVDVADEMFGVPKSMDGKGGTWYTIKYAKENKVPITVIEP